VSDPPSHDWNGELTEQLDAHWHGQLRPRLDGLTDEEYFWEPVPGMWSVRPRGTSTAPMSLGSGDFTIDHARPAPDPPPVTTIAWRLNHLTAVVLGRRVGWHFGGAPLNPATWDYPGDAATARARFDAVYAAWAAGVRGLDAATLARPAGPAEGLYGDRSMATIVLHVNREAIHHGAEIALLRDLYRWQHQPQG
jgi:hypothetical protein